MAQLISVKLSRFDGSPWGFRLQGGKDFGTPLIVQKVSLRFFFFFFIFFVHFRLMSFERSRNIGQGPLMWICDPSKINWAPFDPGKKSIAPSNRNYEIYFKNIKRERL